MGNHREGRGCRVTAHKGGGGEPLKDVEVLGLLHRGVEGQLLRGEGVEWQMPRWVEEAVTEVDCGGRRETHHRIYTRNKSHKPVIKTLSTM